MRNTLLVWLIVSVGTLFNTLALAAAQQPARVLFINPGFATESFWQDVDDYANAAAKALNLDLTIRHADRNHFAMRQILSATLNKPTRPDYVIIVNEKLAADNLLPMLRNYPIYVQVILNDMDEQTKKDIKTRYALARISSP